MKTNEKKSHKKHGMSLVEVIVALAILAVMSMVLTAVARSVDQYRMATKARNDKTALQGPVAESQKNKAASLINDDYVITVNIAGAVTHDDETDKDIVDEKKAMLKTEGEDEDKKTYYSNGIKIHCRLYDAGTGLEQAKDEDDNLITSNISTGPEQVYVSNGEKNFKYIYVPIVHGEKNSAGESTQKVENEWKELEKETDE